MVRAHREAYGQYVATTGASTEAFGAALIAGDYVDWPWWGRLIPEAARDRLRVRCAEAMSGAVERQPGIGEPQDAVAEPEDAVPPGWQR